MFPLLGDTEGAGRLGSDGLPKHSADPPLTAESTYRPSRASAAARMPGQARWTAGGQRASPPPLSATARRPASGDADQTPLGKRGQDKNIVETTCKKGRR